VVGSASGTEHTVCYENKIIYARSLAITSPALDGENKYTLTFEKGAMPPVSAF
jgi:hypothetical protein